MTWKKALLIAAAIVVAVQLAVLVLWALGTFSITHHSKRDGASLGALQS